MSPWHGEAAALAQRVAAFVAASLAATPPPEPFEALALDVHRWQASHDPVVASLLETPATRLVEVPAVPVGVFKELPVGTVRADEAAVVFRTSGTTGGGRGEHRLRSTALYDLGAHGWARRCVPGLPRRIVGLLDDPGVVTDASLSHMVGLFGAATWHVRDGRLDPTGAARAVADQARPLLLAATAFALAEWLDHEPPRLPDGSVVMVTGGFKGRTHRLEGAELYAATHARLRPARIVTEYGMTELSSQLWGTPAATYLPPPWLRVVAVDPVSGHPVVPGEEGQLRFYDLCNLDSTLGIETMDAGVVHDDGSVTLRGRLAGAPARGCSLTVEEAWAR